MLLVNEITGLAQLLKRCVGVVNLAPGMRSKIRSKERANNCENFSGANYELHKQLSEISSTGSKRELELTI